MIADDLTGALDAAVAFASAGIPTCVGRDDYFLHSPEAAACEVQVSVVESRHLSKEEAYQRVYALALKAKGASFTCIYKKTDSALRGNIGAELAAVKNATGEKNLFFIPAYPKMDRITKGGVHYIDGCIPVSESVFGTDPFNPVRHANVLDVIEESTTANAYCASTFSHNDSEGIVVFDATTDADILQIAQVLVKERQGRLFAGCAGFACALRDTLKFSEKAFQEVAPQGNLVIFCGSINPISLKQCEHAAKAGAPNFHLVHNGKFADPGELAVRISAEAKRNPVTIFDTGSVDTATDPEGKAIAKKCSHVIRRVLDLRPEAIPMIIGGDTLIAFIKTLEIDILFPLGELFPGVVLSKYRYQKKWHFLISKSGGFGDPDLLSNIYEKINRPINLTGRCMQEIHDNPEEISDNTKKI